MKPISGYVVVRNGESLDYCYKEAVAALLPVCEEVVVCDSDSTDGTRDILDSLAANDSRIKVINWPWPNPVADSGFFTRWLNFAREHLSHPIQLEMDADEILDDAPECHAAIREAAESAMPRRLFHRINFWKNEEAICEVPENHLVGRWVARLGESSVWMPSDEINTGRTSIRDKAVRDHRLKIFHVGFLRRPDAFFAKAKVCLGAWHGTYDDRLTKMEEAKKPHWDCPGLTFRYLLSPYKDRYPDSVRKWLTERGHELTPSSTS